MTNPKLWWVDFIICPSLGLLLPTCTVGKKPALAGRWSVDFNSCIHVELPEKWEEVVGRGGSPVLGRWISFTVYRQPAKPVQSIRGNGNSITVINWSVY